MAQVTGKLLHLGLQPIKGKQLVLRFHISSAAVGNQTMIPRDWVVEVMPSEIDGAFSVDLAATDNLRPTDVHYWMEALWFNPTIRDGDIPITSELHFKLYVPSSGGEIGDLLRTQRDAGLVWTGDRPLGATSGMRWVDETGRLWEYNGGTWVMVSQLAMFTTEHVPYDYYIGSNLAAARPAWSGPVYWSTTELAGYPSGYDPVQGDVLFRVATSQRQQTVFDTFDRANGAAGSTTVGGKPWVAIPGSAGTVTGLIQDGYLLASGVASTSTSLNGAGVGIQLDSADGYVQWNAGNPGQSRVTALAFRATDVNNFLAIALRTSGTDTTARLASYSGGTATVIASLGVTISDGDIVIAEMRGNQIEILVNNVTRFAGAIEANRTGRYAGFTRAYSNSEMSIGALAAGLVA